MKLDLTTLIIAPWVLISSQAFANSSAQLNPVEAALQVEGAQVTIPVKAAKQTFEPEFISAARKEFNNFHWQMGGDHSLYYNMHMSEFLPTAMAAPNADYRPLEKAIDSRLDTLTVKTETKGEMSMADYLADEQFRTQGFMLIHKGKIVYEAYPGMNPMDKHVWASSAKTTVGTVIAMLVEEGKVDPNAPISTYVPELKGTNWDGVTVLNTLNMSTALDNEETLASILNPDSDVVRFFASAFNSPRATTGEVETWIQVAQGAQKLKGEKPGDHFRYASINTIVLTKLVENIENKSWTQVFEDRVWSKVHARQSMDFNLTPDGTALPVGLVSSTVEDMARWGTLFTPSWKAVADEPVVSEAVIDRIRNSGDPKAFVGTEKENSSIHAFGEKANYNAYQFDFIFDDGAMAKSGNLGQLIYIDPARDFVGVMFSTNPYHSGFGENKGPALMRSAAKMLAD
ncbi:serine hydrolase domain-containing protein [Vibrio breoganii]|uniref:serine hydrolase domain-containing protein n=1 Tax=Vibrio breoganii TaxID=553239 RepID=UPI00080E714C|nr:serine hydrolase domain-containing protein [Vibrio breoganii]OCH75457.1 serine hydrolase [Vibrio breoganii]PMI16219.1 serine hydrolase [Vibrio breoganii]PML28458.1 serine hydrolase [Vibrio breoganii]PMO63023.1 serine hydrolase [Vibrio breoganii]